MRSPPTREDQNEDGVDAQAESSWKNTATLRVGVGVCKPLCVGRCMQWQCITLILAFGNVQSARESWNDTQIMDVAFSHEYTFSLCW